MTLPDVLVEIGWLAPVRVDIWRQGRIAHLQDLVQVGPERVHQALDLLRDWADERGLSPTDITPLARSRHRTELRFSSTCDPELERATRTSWVSANLTERDQQRVVAQQNKAPDLVVISPLKDWTCAECGGSGDLLLMEGPGPICLRCADLDHLAFLPAGNTALTRRAKKASALCAVVVRFARARKRYERQGILVEHEALEAAEQSCLADEEIRARRRERDAEGRLEHDGRSAEELVAEIRRLFPGCPKARARSIAAWTGLRGSGRVGRSAAGRTLDPAAVELAVTASVRHQDTDYDTLLMGGIPRAQARERIRPDAQAVLARWRTR